MLVKQRGYSLVVDAPAKLNLSLDVLGKRSDGYHELETLMVRVGLYDTLRVSPLETDRIDFLCRRSAGSRAQNRDAVPLGDDNLVVRAARLLREETGCSQGARIELFKRIPSESGLGGASSDAAAALLALNRLWKLELSLEQLQRIGGTLGSDVPFFLFQTVAALCRGRGEVVEPVPLSQTLHFVIARPQSGLSTADVYRECEPSAVAKGTGPRIDALNDGRLQQVAQRFHNALQAPAERLNPEVSRTLSQLARHRLLGPTMSGSGTACFGISISRRQALTVAARLRAAGNDRVYAVESRP